MTPTTLPLVSFAVALCLGWALSKAYFRTYGAHKFVSGKKYEDMRKRYRKRLLIMHKLILRHEGTQKQIKEMLKDIQASRQARSDSGNNANGGDDTQGELSTLLNQISERDREIAGLQAQIESPETKPDAQANNAANKEIEKLQTELDELQAMLSEREQQTRELHRNLADSETQCLALKAKVDSWKHRVSPLTEKLKQQRATIRELKTDPVEQS